MQQFSNLKKALLLHSGSMGMDFNLINLRKDPTFTPKILHITEITANLSSYHFTVVYYLFIVFSCSKQDLGGTCQCSGFTYGTHSSITPVGLGDYEVWGIDPELIMCKASALPLQYHLMQMSALWPKTIYALIFIVLE